MKYEIELVEYSPESGLTMTWEPDFRISTLFLIDNDEVPTKDCHFLLCANRDGLISLARILLQLAQDNVPDGVHVHLDELNGVLEKGSCEIILQREDSSPTPIN